MTTHNSTRTPIWMKVTLFAAGLYNLLWGAAIVLFPLVPFRWAGMDPPRYPELWQCIGMIVGVYGVGYLIASRDPVHHWPIVLVGLLGKIFVQVPQHARLAVAYDQTVQQQLVNGNWYRTAAWSARGLVVLIMLGQTCSNIPSL